VFKELVKKSRSFRRFKQDPAPTLEQLAEVVALARLAPSANNDQPLKYFLVKSQEYLDHTFSCLQWAGYLTDWPGPAENERPTAYIIICSDPALRDNPEIDVGLAAQIMIMGLREMGFGTCLLGSVDRPKLQKLLDLPRGLKIHLALAAGTPGEQVELATVADQDTRYWRDENDIHHVPKRKLSELIVRKY